MISHFSVLPNAVRVRLKWSPWPSPSFFEPLPAPRDRWNEQSPPPPRHEFREEWGKRRAERREEEQGRSGLFSVWNNSLSKVVGEHLPSRNRKVGNKRERNEERRDLSEGSSLPSFSFFLLLLSLSPHPWKTSGHFLSILSSGVGGWRQSGRRATRNTGSFATRLALDSEGRPRARRRREIIGITGNHVHFPTNYGHMTWRSPHLPLFVVERKRRQWQQRDRRGEGERITTTTTTIGDTNNGDDDDDDDDDDDGDDDEEEGRRTAEE